MVSNSRPVVSTCQLEGVWRADELGCAGGATLATGHAALDAELPGGGWPVGALCEILQAQSGQQEWRLLLPALRATLSGCVVLVGAPQVPFGPGLAAQGLDVRRLLWLKAATPAQCLWAAEQALRCAAVSAVLAWLPQVRADQLRRLQMAAQAHHQLLFAMRPSQAMAQSSPAVLRLLIDQAGTDALQVHILKRRGPPLAQALLLSARSPRLAAVLARQGGQPQALAHRGGEPLMQAPCFWSGDGDALDCTAASA